MRRLLSVVLVLVLLLTCLPALPLTASAATVASGTCGDNLTWTLDDAGTLTISGTGPMEYLFPSYEWPWENNRSAIKKVVINDGVTSIGWGAFEYCTGLTSITIPDSVTSIGDDAFCGCTGLTSITIPDSVTSIGGWAFYYCTGLTGITIPDSVTSIGDYAFSYCDSLTSITIPDSVTSIGEGAFYDCDSLTSITIPDSVTSIGDWAFYYCTGLTSITIPDSVTSIGDYVFFRCTGLTGITIPDSVTSIGDYAFSDCDRLTSITIPDSVTSIGDYAFSDCTGLTSINIPDSVTSIGDYAFSYCYSLTGITIPDSVTSIGDYAFFNCYNLAAIILPTSVTGIGKDAFSGCNSLNDVYYKGTKAQAEQIEGRSELASATWHYQSTGMPLKIVSQPDSVCGAYNGETVTVSVGAIGDGLKYQWYYKNAWETKFTPTIAFTGNTYSVQMNESRDGRQIYCIITDKYGNSVQSDTATLSLWQQPLYITRQPKSVTVSYGETATVSFEAQGDGLTYAWYYKDVGTSGFIRTYTFSGNTYTAQMNADRDGRELYCVVTDKYGYSAQTNTVSINMDRSSVTPLRVVTQPKSVTVPGGQMATVSFSAEGDGLAYKWYYKNAWETKFTLTTSFTGNTYSAQMNDSRNGRQIYCVVTDQYGNSVQTNTVSINMEQPRVDLKITKQPVSVTVANGAEAKVSFAAQGNGLTYKWYYKNTGDSGFAYTASFTGNTYTVQMSAARAGRQIYCVVTDQYGDSVQTNTVTLNMSKPVKITQQPSSVSVVSGDIATVSFTAQGEGLTYKWYYKNAGDSQFYHTTTFTGNSYSVTMDSSRNGRQLYCVVTDKYGNTARTNTVTIKLKQVTYIASGYASDWTKDEVYWKLDSEGTMTFYGTGRMDDCCESSGTWWRYWSSIKKVVIEKGVTNVGGFLCGGMDNLTTVVISDTVTMIEMDAFLGCKKLENITIPNSVTHIEHEAFGYCTGLKTITIPDSVTKLSNRMFENCTGLTSITLPAQLTEIGFWTFSRCSNLKSVTIPGSVSAIGLGAFENCDNLTDVYFLGTKEQAESIVIGNDNECLKNATWHYQGESVKITKQPTSVVVANGQTATVSFTATGDGLSYAWYYKDVGASGFTRTYTFSGNTYTAQMNASRNGRQIYCVVTDKYGCSTRTDTVTISMTTTPGTAVIITQQPKSVSLARGQSGAVTFTATGEGLTYKWYYKNAWDSKFTLTTSVTGNSYGIPEMNDSRNGRQVYCVVTDKYGNTVQTNTVTMTMR